MGVFDHQRRHTTPVNVAQVTIGGDNPIVVQSMTNTSTNDIEGSCSQIKELSDAGCEIARLTAQGIKEVGSLDIIKQRLRGEGKLIPLVADIHFNTNAAFEAAKVVDKVRINPGNFVDPGRTFKKIEYTDEEYSQELFRLESKVRPFYELCRRNNVAVRIGVNHGSLSDRIMSRYGDTPEGMVESAMEFLRIARNIQFSNIVISIKSSNTRVMVTTVRRLVRAMQAENMNFPLHLGVTEAGEGEDGRIKSAIGIGTLLAEGIGDTIRVSLSENPVNEIPVARELINHIQNRVNAPSIPGTYYSGYNHLSPVRRHTTAYKNIGGANVPVIALDADTETHFDKDIQPDYISFHEFVQVDAEITTEDLTSKLSHSSISAPILITSHHANSLGAIKSFIHRITEDGVMNPVIALLEYPSNIEPWQVTVHAAADFGSMLIDNLLDGIAIKAPQLTFNEQARLLFGILQGTGHRRTKTEYIACPGCGRTLFDLTDTLKKVKNATSHLKELKIGVMGCIVNGPGEMADADYGYVGAAKGKISLYRGKECVERNLPQEHAVAALIELLKKDNVWKNPENS